MKFYDNYNQLNYYYKEHVKIFNGTNTHNINTIYNNIEKYIKIIEQIDNIKYNYSIFYPNPKDICDNDELLNKHFKSLEKYVNIKNDIFTQIKSSTLSVEGLLSSITFKVKLMYLVDIFIFQILFCFCSKLLKSWLR